MTPIPRNSSSGICARRKACIGEGLLDRGESQRNGAGDVGAIFRGDVRALVEAGDLAGDLDRELRRIEHRDASHPATPVLRGFPESFAANAIRTDGSDTGDHDAALHWLYKDTSDRDGFSHLGARGTRAFR